MNVALILGYGIGFIKALLIEKQLDDRFTREFTPFVANMRNMSQQKAMRIPTEFEIFHGFTETALEIDQL